MQIESVVHQIAECEAKGRARPDHLLDDVVAQVVNFRNRPWLSIAEDEHVESLGLFLATQGKVDRRRQRPGRRDTRVV